MAAIRFDYNISERYKLYVRYFRDQGMSSQTQNSTLSQYNQTVVPQNGVITLTQTLTPTILNETKFGVNSSEGARYRSPGPESRCGSLRCHSQPHRRHRPFRVSPGRLALPGFATPDRPHPAVQFV